MAERLTSRRAILAGFAATAAVPASIGLANPGAGAVSDPLHLEKLRLMQQAYRWHQEARPIANVCPWQSLEDRACTAVHKWMWRLCDEVLDLPPPKTAAGMAAITFAVGFIYEGFAACDRSDREDELSIRVARAIIGFTGIPLPPEFVGFGDEPDYAERDEAVMARPGRLPAWALDGRSEPYPADLANGGAA